MPEDANRLDPEPVLDGRYSNDGTAADTGAPKDVTGEYENDDENGSALDASTSSRPHTKRDEDWEARRRYNNKRRQEKAKAARKARVAATRAALEAHAAALTPEQLADWQAARVVERAERAAAEAAQAERLAAALAGGGPGGGPEAALRIAIDCSFAPSAPPKEMRSLCKQIENASSINKRYPRPACLTLTHWGEPLASVAAPCGAEGWRVVKMSQGPAEAFGADRVVVLSPDASEPLTDVDSERFAYVIGGIVDRTHRKGLTLKFAEAQRVDCRRLPVAEHAEQLGMGKGVRKCPVLNIDDVVKALLIFNDTRDWVLALDAAIPSRKRKPQTQGFTKTAADNSDAPAPAPAAGALQERRGDGQEEEEEAGQGQGQDLAEGRVGPLADRDGGDEGGQAGGQGDEEHEEEGEGGRNDGGVAAGQVGRAEDAAELGPQLGALRLEQPSPAQT
ncbi:hypothetical protein PLESTF_000100300 [Pleodorina starrii]|nr:hypothetical protein PLESTM_001266200 [Pleodorina starrii]GLC63933.1 hypothetical protein PLESTF_000100300 [Pleodorina starrii]